MTTAELRPAALEETTGIAAGARTDAAPEWLFDASALAGSGVGTLAGALGAAGVGGLEAIAVASLGVILGGLLGATVGRFVVMPLWVGMARRRGHRA